MTTVLATGTFDLLHPGHVHYLESSKAHGDELVVIVAREAMIDHKELPVLSESQRRDMVAALDPVDEAVLGSRESIFEPLHEIQPDIITIGPDQPHDIPTLESELESRGFAVEVRQIESKTPSDEELYSTSDIIDRVLRSRHLTVPTIYRYQPDGPLIPHF